MTTRKIATCLICSALIHLALCAWVAKTWPTVHVGKPEEEPCIIATPIIGTTEALRSTRFSSQTDMVKPVPHTRQLPATREIGAPTVPKDSHIPAVDLPSITAPAPTPSRSTASEPPPSSANVTQIGRHGTHSKEADTGSNTSTSANQNPGAAPLMALGDAGAPHFIHQEAPLYPRIARKLGKEGHVVLRVALDAQGHVQGIDTVTANGFGFAEAAGAAIRKSTFAPAVRNGRAVSSQVLVPVRFVLHEGQSGKGTLSPRVAGLEIPATAPE